MTNSLTTRQAGIILFVAMLCNKMLSLNSILAFDALNDTWLVFVFSFAIDFLFVLLFLYLVKIIDKPVLQYVKEKFGKFASFTLATLASVLFIFKTTEIIFDIYLFFVQLIYAEINRIIFVTCFAVIVYYFGSRRLRSLGRTAEILITLIVASLVLSFVISMKAFDFEKLLPILNSNIFVLGKNIVTHNLWFGDFLIFFFFIGNVKKEKNTTKKLIFAYLFSCIVVVLFAVVFICAFGNTASMHRVAIIDITEYSPRLIAQGRFNWIVYMTFPIALVLGIGIYSNYVTMCFKFCIKSDVKSKNTISILITLACLFAVSFIFRFSYTRFYDFVTNYMFFYTIFVQYIVPIVLLDMIVIKRHIDQKNHTKNNNLQIKSSQEKTILSKNKVVKV